MLLATPHSNLGQPLCACLVGWYPPSGGVRKQLLLGTPHLGGRGGGASKELEYEALQSEQRSPASRSPVAVRVPSRSTDYRSIHDRTNCWTAGGPGAAVRNPHPFDPPPARTALTLHGVHVFPLYTHRAQKNLSLKPSFRRPLGGRLTLNWELIFSAFFLMKSLFFPPRLS